jgi:hypothetical protein
MSDKPGNIGDQPVPSGPSSEEPVTPGVQSPAWTPPAAPPAWTPQPLTPLAATTETPPPVADQPWTSEPPTPAGDAGQGWPSQPAPYAGAFGQPPQAPGSGKGGRSLLWPIVSIMLLVGLLATAGFAFITYSDLGKTKDSLAAEQTAHQAADANVAALRTCVASMKTDEAALTAAIDTLNAQTARVAAGGDIDSARLAYESALRSAATDYRAAALGFNHAGNQTEWTAAVNLYLQAQGEQATAATLQTTLDTLLGEYRTAVSDASDAVAAATAQMAKTATQCNAATSGSPASP